MSAIQYKKGLELWVWDTGELEGFALYLNGELLDEQNVPLLRYDIGKPDGVSAIVVQFGGADGGATKIVDTEAAKVLVHQDSGTNHGYIVES